MRKKKIQIKVRTIGIIIDLTRSSRRNFLSGFLNAADTGRTWNIQLIQSKEMLTSETVQDWINGAVDGLVILESWNTKGLSIIEESKIPIIAIGAHGQWLGRRKNNITTIRIDDRRIGAYAAEYFLQLGKFASFVYIPAEKDALWSMERESVYREILRKSGINVSTPSENEPIKRLLDRLEKPIAIFAACDRIAAETLNRLGRRVHRIPEQFSIIGVDDDPLLCQATYPQLTSIRPGHFDEGTVAAKEIGNLLNARRQKPRKEILCAKMEITERASTDYTSPAAKLVSDANEFIKRNAVRGISPDDVAHHLGISRRLLDLRFHELNDSSVSRAIRTVRIETLKHELRSSRERLSVVGKRCGFPNANYLKKLFLAETGMTMSEWRRRNTQI